MITVLAATGYTGQLICHELVRRGLKFQIAGRNPEKLRSLATSLKQPGLRSQVVDVLDPDTYSSAFENTRVLINCAGPFTDMGIGIVRAAAERGVHYLDTTGEQYFIKQVHDQCLAIAEKQGSALMPGCAFEYAFGDAGAGLAAQGLKEVEEMAIYYAIGGVGASRGTKKSIIRAITSPAFVYKNGKHVSSSPAAEQRFVEFPKIGKRSVLSFGGGEVFSVPRHVSTQNVATFMSLGGAPPLLLNIAIPIFSTMLKTPLSTLIFKQIDNQSEGPNEQDRKRSLFTILCQARAGGKMQHLTITGTDPYGLTALITAETAGLLLDAGKTVGGATSPAHAFGAETVQHASEAAGVKWHFSQD